MKNIIISLILFVATFVAPSPVLAEDPICVTQYGGAVVCGARTPEYHAPVKAGLGDTDLRVVGGVFLGFAGVLYLKSRRSLTA